MSTKTEFRPRIAALEAEIRELYLGDETPWVVGYSGGKDSTAVLQLVWTALAGLPEEKRLKTVHVISTDTLVENPVVAAWVSRSLGRINEAAVASQLPIRAHRLTPAVEDSFWVNLIGKGYPAPRAKFRWCTERLKIKPSNAFIQSVVRESGEAILVLGTRKAESAIRARVMQKLESRRTRDRLSPNASLPNSLVFSPIEDWSNDDVWLYLMQFRNPWGHTNKDLLTMYQGASEDGECPLVVDSTTPSCGDSRFGCWVCTLVERDKSMAAMISNDEEKEWMLPLLKLRDELGVGDDRHLRDFRRLRGGVTLHHDRLVHGPYLQSAREAWLRRVLEAQTWVRRNGPTEVREIELISFEELIQIRSIWVLEKFEIEDSLPRIYLDVTGEAFPGTPLDDDQPFSADDMQLLRDLAGEDRLLYEMTRDVLMVEWRQRTMKRRARLFERLEATIERHIWSSEEEATDVQLSRRDQLAVDRSTRPEGDHVPV
jgi:DNA sulfur modification protein DndC